MLFRSAQALRDFFRKVDSIGSKNMDNWSQLYNWNSLGIRNAGTYSWQSKEKKYAAFGHPKIKSEVLSAMNKLLRGGDDSVLDHIDPLIPVDFEMEIDGTGGMFPGNSFHSSYVSKRYQEESLFQMVGVSHAISSEGWSTTIKGQIRAVAKQDRSQNLTSGGGNSSDPLTNLDVNNIDSIKAFQRAVGLVDDGIIGSITQRKIDELIDLAKNDALLEHNAHPRVQDDHNEGTGDDSPVKPITYVSSNTPNFQKNMLEVSGEYPVSKKQNERVFGKGRTHAPIGKSLQMVATKFGVSITQLVAWNRDIVGIWVSAGNEGVMGFEKGAVVIVGFEMNGVRVN